MSTHIKTQRALLARAERTETTSSPKQTDASAQFLRVYLNVTDASGTGGLTILVRGYDKISGSAVALNTGGGAITATGLYVVEFSTSSETATDNVLETVARMLPFQWDVQISHGDDSGYTYSVSCEVFPG